MARRIKKVINYTKDLLVRMLLFLFPNKDGFRFDLIRLLTVEDWGPNEWAMWWKWERLTISSDYEPVRAGLRSKARNEFLKRDNKYLWTGTGKFAGASVERTIKAKPIRPNYRAMYEKLANDPSQLSEAGKKTVAEQRKELAAAEAAALQAGETQESVTTKDSSFTNYMETLKK